MRTQKRTGENINRNKLVRHGHGLLRFRPPIVVNQHEGGASIPGGIFGILLGAAFLIAACLHLKRCDQIQGGFQLEEVPADEIVSEMREAAEAMCNF